MPCGSHAWLCLTSQRVWTLEPLQTHWVRIHKADPGMYVCVCVCVLACVYYMHICAHTHTQSPLETSLSSLPQFPSYHSKLHHFQNAFEIYTLGSLSL